MGPGPRGGSLCNVRYLRTAHRRPEIIGQKSGADSGSGLQEPSVVWSTSSAADHGSGGRRSFSFAETKAETDLKPSLGHPELHVAYPELARTHERATKRRRLSPYVGACTFGVLPGNDHEQRELKWLSLMGIVPPARATKSKEIKKLLVDGWVLPPR
ncbi:hypothetical protein B0H17DRAFT_1337771 [Mycena rosella]|uniref:Uncharacterized protein n=1 Tax=Mycena rosella TaxID=1033263 RepID=A0AAD7CQG8_MYCRO|nr:hypothetical protein B0H17DRAFT_1337771 [Mycena rosella]